MTIRDIADMAQVSKGTVSRVINGVPGVGPETRRRVMKIIESLDFHPDAAARRLAAKRTDTLGFVIPHTGRYSMTSTFWPVLLTSITEQAAVRGINVLLSTARSEEDVDSAFQSILKGHRIDGAIIGAEQFGEQQLAELLVKGLPFVTVGRSLSFSPNFVDVDNEEGARVAAEHIVSQGHTSIAMLAGPGRYSYIQDRVRGFRQALNTAGLDFSHVYFCSYRADDAVRTVKSILADDPTLTALFVGAGDFVIATLRACAECSVSVPNTLSVVSFDDHPFFEQLIPPITAVSQPIQELGKAAVDMLFTLMDGSGLLEKSVVLPPKLVARDSCGPPQPR